MNIEPKIVIQYFDQENVEQYLQQLKEITQSYPPSQPIVVEIDSYGGDAYSLIRLIEAFDTIDNKVITYCNSTAMSCGAILLSVIATEGARFMSPNAELMIHEVQAGVPPGDIKSVSGGVEYSKRLNKRVMEMLAKSAGMKSREDIVNLIRSKTEGNELYLEAEEALELGFVDHVGYLNMTPRLEFDIEVRPQSRRELEAEEMAQTLELPPIPEEV
jgi:ATP-dependent protease ClpP protease subunit